MDLATLGELFPDKVNCTVMSFIFLFGAGLVGGLARILGSFIRAGSSDERIEVPWRRYTPLTVVANLLIGGLSGVVVGIFRIPENIHLLVGVGVIAGFVGKPLYDVVAAKIYKRSEEFDIGQLLNRVERTLDRGAESCTRLKERAGLPMQARLTSIHEEDALIKEALERFHVTSEVISDFREKWRIR
jgi:hypothetical protein